MAGNAAVAGVECWALSVERLPPRLRELLVPQLENIDDIPEASAGLPLSSALVFAAAILHSRGHHCGARHCLCGLHFSSRHRLGSSCQDFRSEQA